MNRNQYVKQALSLCGCLVLLFLSIRPVGAAVIGSPITAEVHLDDSFRKIKLNFIENQGQEDRRVLFSVRGINTDLHLTSQGLTFVLSGSASPLQYARVEKATYPRTQGAAKEEENGVISRWVVKLDFVGANPNVRVEGREPTTAAISYFKGPREKWRTGIKAYEGVIYRDLWPGIDLIYTGTINRLKYSFLVKPGADPGRIKLAYRGVSSLIVSDAGQLEVKTPVRVFRDDRPVSYQEVDGSAVEVSTAYEVETDAKKDALSYGFKVGDYDRSKPLVIDPAVLVYCGYIGGSGNDNGRGIAVDSSGNAYVTGQTTSTHTTFPVAVGPEVIHNGGTDVFVLKINPLGQLVYCGYIGGNGEDFAYGIAVDSGGNAYVTGYTDSSEATFPVAIGPDLTFKGQRDTFVAKVNAEGTALVYCGYIGGNGEDFAFGIAVDSAGNAYVTGYTTSSETTFPVTVGPDLTNNGRWDAFVAKVNPSGAAFIYCGYIGGSGNDYGQGIAVDSSGNAYVTGYVLYPSDGAPFPVTVGPDLTFNGFEDAFVAKVNAEGTALVYCGYIGGYGQDSGTAIAVDAGGNAYVTGYTNSSEATFPVAIGPDLTSNGSVEAFVAKVNSTGTALLYCGYIGGSAGDKAYGIAVDAVGNAYVTGYTNSSEATFPVAIGPDLTFNGSVDAFVAKVNAEGTALVYCGYIGGNGVEEQYPLRDISGAYGNCIAVDAGGKAYVTGTARSGEATFPVTAGPDLTYNGGESDAFVAVISAEHLVAIPDIRGEYSGSYTIVVSGCTDPSSDGTYHAVLAMSIPDQTGSIFSGSATGTIKFDDFIGVEYITISGIITETGQISGTTSHTFFATGGSGTFTGQLSGNTLSIVNPGHDKYGETCDYTRTMSATRSGVNKGAMPWLPLLLE